MAADKYFFDFLGRELVTLNVENIAFVLFKSGDDHNFSVAECIYGPLRALSLMGSGHPIFPSPRP